MFMSFMVRNRDYSLKDLLIDCLKKAERFSFCLIFSGYSKTGLMQTVLARSMKFGRVTMVAACLFDSCGYRTAQPDIPVVHTGSEFRGVSKMGIRMGEFENIIS
jgi:hypothetical protein